MQQTVLKAHNLNPAIKSINLVATPSMQSSTLNLDSTSNPNSTFNISADTIAKPTVKPAKAIKPIVESTEATEPVVALTEATKPAEAIPKEEEATLDQLLD